MWLNQHRKKEHTHTRDKRETQFTLIDGIWIEEKKKKFPYLWNLDVVSLNLGIFFKTMYFQREKEKEKKNHCKWTCLGGIPIFVENWYKIIIIQSRMGFF